MVGHSLNSPSVCDIEDIGNEGDLNATQRLMRSDVVVRAKKSTNDTLTNISEAQSFIPGTQKVFIKTWGCTHNNSDGEYMAGLLAANGYEIVDDRDAAHVWLLNSCTVKNPAEDHFRNAVEMGTKRGKFVVVAGCVSQGSPQAEYLEKISIIGVQQIDRVVEVVEETLKGNKVRLLGKKKIGKKKTGGAALDLPKIRRNPLIEIIPINTGCLNQCTYCKTKHARGDLGSYSIEDIVQRAQQVFIEGVKEIWLTSEDTGAYGRDIGVSLPELLNEILPVIPDGCRLRLGMTNPPYILEHLEAMAGILSHPKVYSFLHIPVQSGSDMVLADMKREYCIKDFEKIVDFMRERVPGITIATDMICGFPTETEQDFKLSMALVEKYRFPSLFINQFYPRPGTPAAKMRRVPTQEVKRRTRLMTDLFESYSPYEERIGRVYEVLVTEESHDKLYYVAHNKYYEQILVPKDKKYLGQTINVKITSFGKHFMCGTPLGSHALLAHIKAPLSALRQIDIKSLWITGCVALIIISVVIKLPSKN